MSSNKPSKQNKTNKHKQNTVAYEISLIIGTLYFEPKIKVFNFVDTLIVYSTMTEGKHGSGILKHDSVKTNGVPGNYSFDMSHHIFRFFSIIQDKTTKLMTKV